MTVTYTAAEDLTVKMGTKVVVTGQYTMYHDGRPYSLDAVYDFKGIPPELHGMFLQLISRRESLVGIIPTKREPKLPEPKKSWWRRLWG